VLWHLTRNWRDTRLHRLLLALALVLVAQSGCELLLYAFAGTTGYWSLVGYYIFTFGTIALLPFIAVEIVERRPNPYLAVVAITAGTGIVALLLFTRTIIADVAPMQYSLTRVPGPYYWVFQLSALLTVLFTVVTLAGARRWLESDAPTHRVEIDGFVPHGSVLAPGVVDADSSIREGDEVVIQGPKAFAVGRAQLHGDAMTDATRGEACTVRHVQEL
jgi:predicted RNA-binding protein (TIGR00451 family)